MSPIHLLTLLALLGSGLLMDAPPIMHSGVVRDDLCPVIGKDHRRRSHKRSDVWQPAIPSLWNLLLLPPRSSHC
jgi:hypothetical protein